MKIYDLLYEYCYDSNYSITFLDESDGALIYLSKQLKCTRVALNINESFEKYWIHFGNFQFCIFLAHLNMFKNKRV